MYRTLYKRGIFLVLASILFSASKCEDASIPKPQSYPRIDMPEKEYVLFSDPECPYNFEFPAYGEVEIDTVFFNEDIRDMCWLDLRLPYFNSRIHITYKPIADAGEYEKLVKDAYEMAFKHTIRADFIDETVIRRENSKSLLFDLGGNSASNVQFFTTDSLNHFVRGSLHFREQPNIDSLQPVIDFLRDDIIHLIESIRWTEGG